MLNIANSLEPSQGLCGLNILQPYHEISEIILCTSINTIEGEPPRLPVITAQPGVGKSTGLVKMVRHQMEMDEGFTTALALPGVRNVQDMLRGFRAELPDRLAKEVCAWTADHDREVDTRRRGEFGIASEDLFTKKDLRNHRVVLVSHEYWKRCIPFKELSAIFNFKDGARSVIYVDEAPSAVDQIMRKPSDIDSLKDLLFELGGTAPVLDLLEEIRSRMLRARKGGGRASYVELIQDDECELLKGIRRDWLFTQSKFSREKLNHLWGTISFLSSAAEKRVFLSGAEYTSYALTTPPERHIYLDGTARIDGRTNRLRGVEFIQSQPVDYSKLTIQPLFVPSKYLHKRTLERDKTMLDDYVRLVKSAVDLNSEPGDEVLIVSHKFVIDALKKITWRPDMKVHPSLYYGMPTGTNSYRTANRVFVFGEHHLPMPSLLAEHLSYGDILASECDFRAFQAGVPGTSLEDLQKGNILKSLIQLACRGRCRNIDEHGVAQEMQVYTTAGVAIAAELHRYFNGSLLCTPDYTFAETLQKPSDKIIKFIQERPGGMDCIAFSEISKACSIAINKLKTHLNGLKVTEVLRDCGYEVVSAAYCLHIKRGQALLRKR